MIFAVAAMLSMTMAFADNENTNSVNNAEAYNMNINMNMLSRALDLTGDQKASVADIHKVFCAEMDFAGLLFLTIISRFFSKLKTIPPLNL